MHVELLHRLLDQLERRRDEEEILKERTVGAKNRRDEK